MELENKLLEAWIYISSVLNKNNITKDLTYNESVVMLAVYKKYLEKNEAISIKEIVEETKICKSLVNRIINALKKKELIVEKKMKGDARFAYVYLVENNKEIFLKTHNESLNLAKEIIKIIGEKNAESFINSIEILRERDFSIEKGN